MSEREVQPRKENLIGQYRDIGPAALVAAFMSSAHKCEKPKNETVCNSILARKKSV